jgi:hypothetical protein
VDALKKMNKAKGIAEASTKMAKVTKMAEKVSRVSSKHETLIEAMSWVAEFVIEEIADPSYFGEEKKLEIFVLDAEVFDTDEQDFEHDLEGMQRACNQPKVIDIDEQELWEGNRTENGSGRMLASNEKE